MLRDLSIPCTHSCSYQVPTISAHKAATVGCGGYTLPCQPVWFTEKQMFPKPVLPKLLEPWSLWYVGRLGAPHTPTLVSSHLAVLPARLKVSGDCRFFPPLEFGSHTYAKSHLPNVALSLLLPPVLLRRCALSQPVAVFTHKGFCSCHPSLKWHLPFFSWVPRAVVRRMG